VQEVDGASYVVDALGERKVMLLRAWKSASRIIVRLTALAYSVKPQDNNRASGVLECGDNCTSETNHGLLGLSPRRRNDDRDMRLPITPLIKDCPEALSFGVRKIDDLDRTRGSGRSMRQREGRTH